MMERHDIEGRMPEEIAADLTHAFDRSARPRGLRLCRANRVAEKPFSLSS